MEISERIKHRGLKLFKSGKVKMDMDSGRRVYFKVMGTEEHSVIWDREKNGWSCDCQYFSLRFKTCSHIYASKLFLEKYRVNP